MSVQAASTRRRRRRGTARNPGAHLHKMPVALDFAGISVAEGVRAALATSIFLILNEWVHSTPLLIAAVGAMITCFCDTGGTLRQRLPMLLSFTFVGALTWALFGLIRAGGIVVVLPTTGCAVFLFSMARLWGLRAQTVGNIAIVVLALAIDKPLGADEALTFFLAFGAGGLWACLLTLLIWRINPDRSTWAAVADVWMGLADLAQDMRDLAADTDALAADWEAHARAHRRAVRAAIEDARQIVSSSLRGRGLLSGRGTRAALMLEMADQLFGEMIILSELLEADTGAGTRAQAERMLRRLRPIFKVVSLEQVPQPARIATALDNILRDDAEAPALRNLTGLIVDRLRVTLRVIEGQEQPTVATALNPPAHTPWLQRVWRPLRGELTWQSAILRHAVRATILTVPAVAITLIWWTPYAHWLTITVALTMQPFFAATWQRALERIAGTVLGACIGGALAFLPPTPLWTAAALLPLSIIGFSVRQVSYGAYIACLTPLVVLLFDIVEPGHSALTVAAMRTLYTLVGGGVAVSACLLLWPSWEPRRLQRELAITLRAYGRLAGAVLRNPTPARRSETEDARRAAGLANNNFEASLSRALQEPGRGNRDDLVKIIAADAILRRLGAALLAVPHDASVREILRGTERQRWEAYLDEAFSTMAEGRPAPKAAPDAPVSSTLQRVRRGIETLSADLFEGDHPAIHTGLS